MLNKTPRDKSESVTKTLSQIKVRQHAQAKLVQQSS
jgi:hypothetical protein